MAEYQARIAPFINIEFVVTAQAGIYPSGGYHSGVDISTGTGTRGSNLYSIVNGTVIRKDYNASGYGNFIIIKDDESDFAFLFAHMADPALFNAGDKIRIGEQFGVEGSTGNVTGLHTHIEMQNYKNNGNTWIYNASDPSLWGTVYLDATEFMGFPNVLGATVIYDGTIPPQPKPTKSNSIKWLRARAKKICIKG